MQIARKLDRNVGTVNVQLVQPVGTRYDNNFLGTNVTNLTCPITESQHAINLPYQVFSNYIWEN